MESADRPSQPNCKVLLRVILVINSRRLLIPAVSYPSTYSRNQRMEQGEQVDQEDGQHFSSPVPSIPSLLADAVKENEPHRDLSFVSRVREVSVESLLEFARPFFDSPISEQESGKRSTANLESLSENHYDALGVKIENLEINDLSKAELEKTVDILKDRILSLSADAEDPERTVLVQKLVLARLKILESDDTTVKAGKISMGHCFKQAALFRHMIKRGRHCEVCGQLMIFARSQLDCSFCDFSCHERCISNIARYCVATQIEQKAEYVLDICPEKGLDASQNFACAECKKPFPMDNANVWDTHIRLCDYSGRYYCTICHRNDMEISPGRVVKNWDFSKRAVCRASKQALRLLNTAPILDISLLNKDLLALVEELSCIQELRNKLSIMERILLDCEQGPQIALLHRIPPYRKHFLARSALYSVADLADVERGVLLKELTSFADELEGHIRVTCQYCQGLATICAVCFKENDKLYPFEERAAACSTCGVALHKSCARINPECVCCRKAG